MNGSFLGANLSNIREKCSGKATKWIFFLLTMIFVLNGFAHSDTNHSESNEPAFRVTWEVALDH
jgi:hypothetical protein